MKKDDGIRALIFTRYFRNRAFFSRRIISSGRLKKLVGRVRPLFFRYGPKSSWLQITSFTHKIQGRYTTSPLLSKKKTQISMFSSMSGCVKYLPGIARRLRVYSKNTSVYLKYIGVWREKVRQPSAFEVTEEAGGRNRVAIGDNKVT